jgi:N-acetylmuramoyl-L-alanine amidase
MLWIKGGRVRSWLSCAAGGVACSLILVAQVATPPAQPQTTPNPTPNQQSVPSTTAAPMRLQFIIIDPAHGGSESGAILNPAVLEKDVNLAFARRLRQELSSRGIQAQLLRDGDVLLTTDQRASMVNSARPALYLGIHAASQGRGMGIYTAMLSDDPGADDRGPFLNWRTAQSATLPRSRATQQQLAEAIQKTGFPVRAVGAPLRPLSNIVVPALAIEIAPTTGDTSQLASPDYQQMVSAVLANAIATIRTRLGNAP